MIKADYKEVRELFIDEKLASLEKYGNIYTFGVRFAPALVNEMIKDINDFLEGFEELCNKGDVYIEQCCDASEVKNYTNIDNKDLKVLKVYYDDHRGTKNYFMLVAISAVKLDIVDVYNRDVFRTYGDNPVNFYVESVRPTMIPGSFTIREASFNLNK